MVLLERVRRVQNAANRLDQWLLGASSGVRRAAYLLTAIVMVATSLPKVPRPWLDFRELPLLHRVGQPTTYGPDSIGDMYTARTVLNDPRDMFTKRLVEQTPLEAATWSREASAPYPPVVLLTETGLLWVGQRIGVGFYGMILGLAIAFLTVSAWYFWRTRWYFFPLLYINFGYFSERFVYVQDNTYLVMLTAVLAALVVAHVAPRRESVANVLMALAITMKLSPLFYVTNVVHMRQRIRWLFILVLVMGLIVPYFVWENYLYIYRYGSALKGDWNDAVGAGAVAGLFGLTICYVDRRLGFDLEDRIGWGLVPFAMLMGLKMNVARHLLIVLLVPDKRGLRNVAAAVGLAVPVLLPSVARFNAALPAATVVLGIGLLCHLERIGWATVRDDLAHPRRTLLMLASARPSLVRTERVG